MVVEVMAAAQVVGVDMEVEVVEDKVVVMLEEDLDMEAGMAVAVVVEVMVVGGSMVVVMVEVKEVELGEATDLA